MVSSTNKHIPNLATIQNHKGKVALFWFRRDLRLQDNHGLFQALKHEKEVLPLFIFDKTWVDELADRRDARVSFVHDAISQLQRVYERNDLDYYQRAKVTARLSEMRLEFEQLVRLGFIDARGPA